MFQNKVNNYLICSCNLIIRIPKNDLKELKLKKCPSCGEEANENWELKNLEWIRTSVWYNPLSWGKGYYQEK